MFIKYSSIENIKTVLKNLNHKYPEVRNIKIRGTVKVHGTNAGICLTEETKQPQSRNRTLSIDYDNAGFAAFTHRLDTSSIIDHKKLLQENDIDSVYIYGEWCGSNIQKGVSVSGMEKAYIIFSVVGVKNGEKVEKFDLDVICSDAAQRVYKITDFCTYSPEKEFDIFTGMDELIEYTSKITLDVEENCPVGAILNPTSENTIGEGVVWEVVGYPDIGLFKTKGEKHSRSSKGKRIVNVEEASPERKKAVEDFLAIAVSEDRLNQGIEYLNEMLIPLEPKNTGEYIKWVCKDIVKELPDEIVELETTHNINWKQISKNIIQVARQFYMSYN